MVMKKSLKKFAITFRPRKDEFEVREIKKGRTIPKNLKSNNTSIVRARTPTQAFNKLSARSFKGETGRKLR